MEKEYEEKTTAFFQKQEVKLKDYQEELLEERGYWKKKASEYQKSFDERLGRLFFLLSIGGGSIAFVWLISFIALHQANPFAVTPWLVILGAVSSPFVWQLRSLSLLRREAQVLEQEFFRKAFVEQYIVLRSEGDEKMRKEMAREALRHWIERSPAEILSATQRKKEIGGLLGQQAAEEMLKRATRSENT